MVHINVLKFVRNVFSPRTMSDPGNGNGYFGSDCRRVRDGPAQIAFAIDRRPRLARAVATEVRGAPGLGG